MIYLLGFRTPNQDEVPEFLYVGMDGVEAERIAESAPHPRIARLINPQLAPIRHWSEEGAAACEALTAPPAPEEHSPISPQSHETPAADEPVTGAAAESSADEPAGPQLGADPPAGKKRR